MRKTNEELDDLISGQEEKIAADADKTDVRRGHVTQANGQLIKNRRDAIQTLESQKELTTVKLRSGI
jgi:hypothetical protein